ncbi:MULTISPECIES: D-glycero-beta-D-manno-heptose 1-phosphate adenylyltransferase [Psychrilyobacter]|uniref:D-glycero-beta-D-manno-heptose 1-phosphate adenylyltransferase n=1 Tax=Psychrilyobacter piezotolerans TaxID=2293438 RepID=A0ABX9KL23_9FUSO|nr:MULTISPECIES: D-glycero-beta-D-manno-heptose 1-phosphate adenylyltransferase [Psychrilyobacter]MCS5422618.1 D-glycero-beta-D-manno-heptose 1-phosphate adenylyltransferase [Psychrilyobacter sp. S5]NDI76480.1 D-glycero-beta-D-manno-heptose 1-phosphate adenylyltransferase [Psychrilyobacter piezotolerans]RDE66074.1 D-glycero-beta-D-manno-heptose 1-phosphate adenylyltransferase [Psychrilyobacter sp. S5]REI43252.1 D-glycero-beta-D-manno-heptose 1-phosphate adenylyltransferase [Psychrilyobacter pie
MSILTREEAGKLVEGLKESGKKVVFTNGCFDILHVGHLRYLNEARECGDILIVGVNSDDSVRRLKGPTRPINGEMDRAELLCGLKAVDYAVIFPEDTPVEIIETLKPSIHVKGGDYKKEDLPETVVVEKNGGEVRILTLVDGKSTSNVVKKIAENKN